MGSSMGSCCVCYGYGLCVVGRWVGLCLYPMHHDQTKQPQVRTIYKPVL